MRLPANVKPGTRVDCNVRGRRFSAVVVAQDEQGLAVSPPRGYTYHHVTPRQVEKLYRWNPSQTQIRDE